MSSRVSRGAPRGLAAGETAGHRALALGSIRPERVRRSPITPSWVLKVLMAATGVVFALFALVHMVGNLKVFTGAEHFNAYAHWLRTVLQPFLPYEGLLWILRVVLLACLLVHVWAAALIWGRGRTSRGAHRRRRMWVRSFAARTMPVTGIVLLGFVVFHVLDLTTGTPGVAADAFRAATPDATHAHENLVASMQRPAVAAAYLATMLALFLHLAHGLWTVVNDVGMTGRRLRTIGWLVAGVVALVVTLGNALVPIAVLLGVVV